MAATSIGLTSVSFGLSQETGVVIQSFSSTETMETSELSSHNGQFAAVAFSARRNNISLSGNSTTAQGTIGAALSLTGNSSSITSGSFYITDSSLAQTNDGFYSFDLSASNYPQLGT